MLTGTKKTILGSLMAFLSGALYGTYPIFAKYALAASITDSTILFLRFLGCILFLWGVIFITKRDWKIHRGDAVRLLSLGCLIYALMPALNLIAIGRTSASLASLLLCTYPVFVVLLSALLFKEPISAKKIVSLALCFAGLFLLLDVSAKDYSLSGALFALGASFALTAYIIIGSAFAKGVDPIVKAAFISSGATIAYAVMGLISRDLCFYATPPNLKLMAAMSLLSTALPVMLFWSAIRLIGASNTSIIMTVDSLSTLVLAAFIFGELLTSRQVAGALSVILGVLLIQLPGKQTPSPTD